jgi:Zn-dependent metalloprotease
MEQTYDFYKEKLGINGINDSGFKMVAQVHYRTKYNNANWDGKRLNFGDGDGVSFRPLTSIDVCGHEMTHGLTQSCAGLIYKNESGGLNESFSDIFGKCIEHYAIPDSFSWLMGEKIQFNGNYLRSMQQPTLKNNPKYYEGQYFVYSGNVYDNGGVHINSGISNYWFYLLCEGGTGVRESDNKPFTVEAIGWDKATAIAFATLSNYLVPTSEFFDASELSQLATKNLYGENSNEAKQVLMAWYGVGLASLPGSNVANSIKVQNNISILPNPSEKSIRISLNSNQLLNATLFDITGKRIKNIEVYNGVEIDITEFEKGIYLLGFSDGSAIKFVKI